LLYAELFDEHFKKNMFDTTTNNHGPDQTPLPYRDLLFAKVEQMLRVNPAIRISASTLLKHPWIKVGEFCWKKGS